MTRNGTHKTQELTTAEAKKLVLDEVKKICPTGSIAFSGGEFLTRKDALELVEYNSRIGLYSFVNTNGSLLDEDRVREILRAASGRAAFGFSLDSLDDAVQGDCRGTRAEEILRLFDLCDRMGAGYFVLVTISKKNLATLPQTAEYLKKRGIPMIRSPFVPRGAAANLRENMFTKSDMERLIHPVLLQNHLCYVSHTPFFAPPGATRLGLRKIGVTLATLGCQAGRTFIGISAEGDVAPCVHLLDSPVKCGNVRETPLAEMYRTSPLIAAMKDGSAVKGKCGRCRYKHSCRGCRALAHYHGGDWLGEDPTCFFEPDGERKASPHEATASRNTRAFVEFIATNKPWRDVFAGGIGGKIGMSLIRSAAKIRGALTRAKSGVSGDADSSR
jgi:radical SAM protein with 4Fe4S-binding SPASM domain